MATAFIETPRFPMIPIDWEFGFAAQSSAERIRTPSGIRQVIIRSDRDLLRGHVRTSYLTAADRDALLAFLRGTRLGVVAFRVKDLTDYQMAAQPLGVGDGATHAWQLIKVYAAGTSQYRRSITKPVPGTVVVLKDGVPLGSGWSVDTTTGIVTVSTSIDDAVYTVSCEFDVPMAFTGDYDLTGPFYGRWVAETLTLEEVVV